MRGIGEFTNREICLMRGLPVVHIFIHSENIDRNWINSH